MTRRTVLALLLCFAAVPVASAQRGEFLSDGEISQIREAQEPNQRLKLYVEFARYRLDTIEKALAGNDENRAEAIHQNLREYDRIIDAIDNNAEQAVSRRDLARKGLELALEKEPEFLKLLQSFRTRNPKDLDEYRFILDRAIETTESSIELLREALSKQPKDRKEAEREQKKRQEQEQITPKEAAPPQPKEAGPPRKPKRG